MREIQTSLKTVYETIQSAVTLPGVPRGGSIRPICASTWSLANLAIHAATPFVESPSEMQSIADLMLPPVASNITDSPPGS